MRKLLSHKVEEGIEYVTGCNISFINERGETKTFVQTFDVPIYVWKSDELILSLQRKYNKRR